MPGAKTSCNRNPFKECYETFKEKAYSTVIEHRISKQRGYYKIYGNI
jgi:hypothetical protein